MWMLDNICEVSDHASKSQSTEDIKLMLHALMLMRQPSACLMPNYKNTVHQPSKPMKISTTDNSGNWIYPVWTVSVLTSPLKRLASLQVSKSFVLNFAEERSGPSLRFPMSLELVDSVMLWLWKIVAPIKSRRKYFTPWEICQISVRGILYVQWSLVF